MYVLKRRANSCSYICKPCAKAKVARFRATPRGKQRTAEIDARSAIKYPQRAAARKALNSALSVGSVLKQPQCQFPLCTTTRVQAHHPDYTKPLHVVWYCTSHHARLHAQFRLISLS